ncbi:MAG TPA: redoxin domain-containing protein [Acidobacteriota bacterium]|nr:redoxin domain-containing protein [Acidobacteriota bacterium]
MLKIGDRAPHFKLSPLRGRQPFDLSEQLARGPVMLVFAKESCPTCRWTLPLLDPAGLEASGEKGQMVVVLQELPWVAEEMVEELGLGSPVLVDDDPYPVSNAFGIDFVPSAFLIGPDGKVAAVSESFQRDELSRMIESLYRRNAKTPRAVFRPEDEIPPFRPG